MKYSINTDQYQFTWNKKPRGYGMWMYNVDGRGPFCHVGTISELRKHLAATYKNHEVITILP